MFGGRPPEGPREDPPQIADTHCVLHQKGTQRETAKSQILSVFRIQQGWEKTRVSVLSPYWGSLAAEAAQAGQDFATVLGIEENKPTNDRFQPLILATVSGNEAIWEVLYEGGW